MHAVPDHAPWLERAFELVPEEASYRVEPSRGEIPAYVRGTYYVNGPARFGRGDRRYGHWLDGDGMVVSLRFGDDGVRLTSRFVRSHKWNDEEEAGCSLYRGFGTAFEGDRLLRGILLASPVNVSVYPVEDRLLAFGEQGLPWELDPETLETLGEETFGGKLNAVSPFSAHPHFSADGREMFNFGLSFAARTPMINLYRFTVDGEMIYRKRIPIERPTMAHDFMLGVRHVIFHLAPHVMDMETFARDGGSVMDALSWRPELGSRLVIVDRESGEKTAEVPLEAGYSLHLIGSFERDGRLVVDTVELDEPVYDQYQVPEGLFRDVRRARPVRFELDLETFELLDKQTLDYGLMCDFPAVDPRKVQQDYRDFWVLGISATEEPGRKFFDQVVHCDWRAGRATGIWQAPAGCYLGGEPVFVPDPESERAGAVICQIFDARAEKGSFLVFDAFDLGRGPVAELPQRRPFHLGFHASFRPDHP